MKQFSRKCSWLMISVGLFGSLVSCTSVKKLDPFPSTGFEFGCMVGDVTSHEGVVWLKTADAQEVQVQFTTDPLWGTFQETSPVSTTRDRDFTARIFLSNLTPKTRYLYRSIMPGKRPGPVCRFVTAPLPNDPAPVTFVIGGDTRHSFQPFSIMDSMRAAQPDFFVYLGDTIYADKGNAALTLPDYWAKYRENRGGFMEYFFAETSVYAMWDDHEVDSDFISTHARMSIGRQAFFDYWPIRSDSQDPYRLYRSFRWGQTVEFFLLDTRQYRDPSTHTMLGEVQKRWLMERLKASSAEVKFIMTSVPISDPGKDKWGEYAKERDEILDFIGNQGITGVAFLATDVHHAAIAKVPGPVRLKEFIFGPLAAPMNYFINSEEARFEYFNDQYRNYGKVTIQAENSTPIVKIEWFGEGNVLLHDVVLSTDSSGNLGSVDPKKETTHSGK